MWGGAETGAAGWAAAAFFVGAGLYAVSMPPVPEVLMTEQIGRDIYGRLSEGGSVPWRLMKTVVSSEYTWLSVIGYFLVTNIGSMAADFPKFIAETRISAEETQPFLATINNYAFGNVTETQLTAGEQLKTALAHRPEPDRPVLRLPRRQPGGDSHAPHDLGADPRRSVRRRRARVQEKESGHHALAAQLDCHAGADVRADLLHHQPGRPHDDGPGLRRQQRRHVDADWPHDCGGLGDYGQLGAPPRAVCLVGVQSQPHQKC